MVSIMLSDTLAAKPLMSAVDGVSVNVIDHSSFALVLTVFVGDDATCVDNLLNSLVDNR